MPRITRSRAKTGAKLKDKLERRLHALVCIDHALSLHDAQEAIARDWIAAYTKYIGER